MAKGASLIKLVPCPFQIYNPRVENPRVNFHHHRERIFEPFQFRWITGGGEGRSGSLPQLFPRHDTPRVSGLLLFWKQSDVLSARESMCFRTRLAHPSLLLPLLSNCISMARLQAARSSFASVSPPSPPRLPFSTRISLFRPFRRWCARFSWRGIFGCSSYKSVVVGQEEMSPISWRRREGGICWCWGCGRISLIARIRFVPRGEIFPERRKRRGFVLAESL